MGASVPKLPRPGKGIWRQRHRCRRRHCSALSSLCTPMHSLWAAAPACRGRMQRLWAACRGYGPHPQRMLRLWAAAPSLPPVHIPSACGGGQGSSSNPPSTRTRGAAAYGAATPPSACTDHALVCTRSLTFACSLLASSTRSHTCSLTFSVFIPELKHTFPHSLTHSRTSNTLAHMRSRPAAHMLLVALQTRSAQRSQAHAWWSRPPSLRSTMRSCATCWLCPERPLRWDTTKMDRRTEACMHGGLALGRNACTQASAHAVIV